MEGWGQATAEIGAVPARGIPREVGFLLASSVGAPHTLVVGVSRGHAQDPRLWCCLCLGFPGRSCKING